jgi:hypothetical protein
MINETLIASLGFDDSEIDAQLSSSYGKALASAMLNDTQYSWTS